MTCPGGQCSVSMPDEVGPPNGAATPKRCFASSSTASLMPGDARAHLAEGARAALRRDAVEDEPRDLALRRAPAAPRAAIRLASERSMIAVVEHLEPVRRERRAGGGDVDDQLGGAGGRRAFGRAEALDDAVVDDAVLGEEAGASGSRIWSRPASCGRASRGTRSRRRRGPPWCARRSRPAAPRPRHWPRRSRASSISTTRARRRDRLADQVLAGDAEMHRALRELRGDVGGREIGDLDARQAGDRAAIVARAARLHELQAGAREERLGVLLQPALRRHRENERRAHALAVPISVRGARSSTAKPTAGIGCGRAEPRSSPS